MKQISCIATVSYLRNKITSFFLHVFETIMEINLDYDHVIWGGGDLNVWLNPDLDKRGGRTTPLSQSARVVNEFLEQYDWIDVWRYANPNKYQYTWKQKKPFLGSRLDYFLVPVHTLSNVQQIEIITGCGSDHLFVEIELRFETMFKGKGLWKLNNSFLRDKVYVEGINKLIDDFDEVRNVNDELDPSLSWEMFKQKVYSFLRKYGKEKASDRRQQIALLNKKIVTQEKKLAMIKLSSYTAISVIEKINFKIDELKMKLNKHLKYVAQAALLRSKIKWYVEGEHCTSYFCSLEKAKAKGKQMSATKRHDGTITRNIKEILDLQTEFYQKLYTKNDSIKFRQTNSTAIQLTQAQKLETEKEITVEEIRQAIFAQMPYNKSPGVDGITADFYKMFWSRLKEILHKLYNHCFKVGRMHTSARQGVITIIREKS